MRFYIYQKETAGVYILARQNPGNPVNDDQHACDEMIRHVMRSQCVLCYVLRCMVWRHLRSISSNEFILEYKAPFVTLVRHGATKATL